MMPLVWTCPDCGETERPGHRCLCGLLWNENRLGFHHYARRMSTGDAEELRHKIARRRTRAIVNNCHILTKRQGPRLFCVAKVLDRMWKQPE